MSSPKNSSDRATQRSALIAGIVCFITWGLIPGYWKLLHRVSAPEILAHRFLWTSLFLVLVLSWRGRWKEVQNVFRSRTTLLYCASSGLAIATNWFFFIFAVLINHVLETSLGYFMTPLVNVLFGAVFLRERLTRLQLFSVLLAAAGVLYLALGYGRFPWIAVTLCTTFGFYGLLRKKSGTAAVPGLFVETITLLPIALFYLSWLSAHGQTSYGKGGWGISLLLMSTGVVTAVPLFWFGHAARHLPLTTLGFLQYLSPSASFLLAVCVYHEPLTPAYLVVFGLIWVALAIFTFDAARRWRSERVHPAVISGAAETPA